MVVEVHIGDYFIVEHRKGVFICPIRPNKLALQTISFSSEEFSKIFLITSAEPMKGNDRDSWTSLRTGSTHAAETTLENRAL
jgi:hypothetical protein